MRGIDYPGWLHLDVLSLFDPFLFLLHIGGFISWVGSDASPAILFSTLYGVTFLYIGLRAYHHRYVVRLVQRVLGEQGICHVIPSLHWFHWQFVMETNKQFLTGYVRFIQVQLCETYSKQEDNPIIQASMGTDGVLPFGVNVELDQDLNVIHYKLGWRKKSWEAPYVYFSLIMFN